VKTECNLAEFSKEGYDYGGDGGMWEYVDNKINLKHNRMLQSKAWLHFEIMY
jgi:hypothetical protein